MILIPALQKIPCYCYFVRFEKIPSLKDVECLIEVDAIDVTVSTDVYCHTVAGLVNVYDKNHKTRLMRDVPGIVQIACNGGGLYQWIAENSLFTCQTKEEYETELKREYDEELEEMLDY